MPQDGRVDVGRQHERHRLVTAGSDRTAVQLVGGYYIGHVYKHSTNAYGTFGLVIALLVWLRLGAQVLLYTAELNVVVSRRLWPRSLFGAPTEPADQETLTALAKVEERHDEEQIDVDFKS